MDRNRKPVIASAADEQARENGRLPCLEAK
jgi:hypothetical protein